MAKIKGIIIEGRLLLYEISMTEKPIYEVYPINIIKVIEIYSIIKVFEPNGGYPG